MGRKFKEFKGVSEKSDTSLKVSFSYKGKQHHEAFKRDPNKIESWQELSDIVIDIKREVRDGVFDYLRWFPKSSSAAKYKPTRGALLKDYLVYYLEKRNNGIPELGKKPLATSSYVHSKHTIKGQLTPAFGEICVDELTADHVYKWAAKYGKTCTTNTLSNIISPLRVALDLAVFEKHIAVNPLKNITVYGLIKSKKSKKHDPFDRDEIKHILLASSGQLHNYIRFAFFTGMRPSEIIALTWDDYNAALKTIEVDKALTDSDIIAGECKTYASNRTVYLSPTAIYALECQKMHTKLHNKEIFFNPFTEQSWTGSVQIRQRWITLLNKAKVRYRKPYQTRHTYASMQLTVGENLAFISEQMGHTDVAFTLRTYASYIQKHSPDAGYKADREFTDLVTNKQKLLVLD